jgi:type III pantothenate kinase
VKNICIDIGNTQSKIGIFEDSELIDTILVNSITEDLLDTLFNKYHIKNSIVSNVNESSSKITEILKSKTNYINFDNFTKIPFLNLYKTPETLGLDRIALVAAATNLETPNNVLVVSLGTCVTFEFLNRKLEYLGGAISPGLLMRLKAMNEFTAKLPLLDLDEPTDFNGSSTNECMQSGAFYGITGEINGRLSLYENKFGKTDLVLSGGDCFLFEKHLKNALFAHPYLTLFGLNKIINYNV